MAKSKRDAVAPRGGAMQEARFVLVWMVVVLSYIAGPIGAALLLRKVCQQGINLRIAMFAALGAAATLWPLSGRWDGFILLLGRLFNPAGRPIGEYV